MAFVHEPVLLAEVLQWMNVRENGVYADGTLGGYSSGVERKRFLLRLEGLSIPESKPPRRVGKRGVRAR